MDILEQSISRIRAELLTSRMADQLTGSDVVLTIVRRHEPEFGIGNLGWAAVCSFILEIEPVKTADQAQAISEKYNLELTF